MQGIVDPHLPLLRPTHRVSVEWSTTSTPSVEVALVLVNLLEVSHHHWNQVHLRCVPDIRKAVAFSFVFNALVGFQRETTSPENDVVVRIIDLIPLEIVIPGLQPFLRQWRWCTPVGIIGADKFVDLFGGAPIQVTREQARPDFHSAFFVLHCS